MNKCLKTIILIILCFNLINSEVTKTECSCGFTLIVVCPGIIQCTKACWDFTGISVCVLNEGDGKHYCECLGKKKSEEKNLQFLE